MHVCPQTGNHSISIIFSGKLIKDAKHAQQTMGCDEKKCRGLHVGNAVGINSYLTIATESQLNHNHMVYRPPKHNTVNEVFFLYINIHLCKVMLQKG